MRRHVLQAAGYSAQAYTSAGRSSAWWQAARWAVGTYALGTALATENDRISVLPPNTVALSVAASLKSAATAVREAIPTPPGTIHVEGYPEGHSVGPGSIGMWTVQDHDGLDFTDTDLLGQYALLTFGSVHGDGAAVHDVLKRMLATSDRIVKLSNMRIQTALVSITPESDTPPTLRAAVDDVSPEVWAFTGPDCRDVAEAALDFVQRFVPDMDGVTLQHLPGLLFLVNPAGEFVGVWRAGEEGDLGALVAEQVRAWKQRHTNWMGPWGPHSIKPRVA